jgi:hypothetical protein
MKGDVFDVLDLAVQRSADLTEALDSAFVCLEKGPPIPVQQKSTNKGFCAAKDAEKQTADNIIQIFILHKEQQTAHEKQEKNATDQANDDRSLPGYVVGKDTYHPITPGTIVA